MTPLKMFALTLYFEAGSTCDFLETYFLAWVIRNRVKRGGWFGKGYDGVCLKPWQFSCWNNKTKKQIEKIDLDGKFRYMVCQAIAEIVSKAPAKWNPIPATCYYYNPELVCPKWARKFKRVYPVLKLIHIFFKSK